MNGNVPWQSSTFRSCIFASQSIVVLVTRTHTWVNVPRMRNMYLCNGSSENIFLLSLYIPILWKMRGCPVLKHSFFPTSGVPLWDYHKVRGCSLLVKVTATIRRNWNSWHGQKNCSICKKSPALVKVSAATSRKREKVSPSLGPAWLKTEEAGAT